MEFIKNQINLLINDEVEQIIKNLDEKYKNENITKLSIISDIRMGYLNRNIYHRDFFKSLLIIRKLVKQLMPNLIHNLKSFSIMSLKDKYMVQKRIISKGEYFKNELDILIKHLPIVVESFFQLKPTKTDLKIKLLNEDKLTQLKHSNAIKINVPEINDRLLKNIKNEENINLIYLGILLSCGRRKSEIISGNFSKIDNNNKQCLFSRQFKKQQDNTPFIIPLLIEYDIFINCLKKVKEYFNDCSTNKKYHNKSRRIEIYLKKNFIGINNLHMLRSIYALICDNKYGGSSTRYIMKILGENSPSSILSHYTSVNLDFNICT